MDAGPPAVVGGGSADLKRTLLVDSDTLAYKHSARAEETFDWGGGVVSAKADVNAALRGFLAEVETIREDLHADAVVLACSCPSRRYWRHGIYPDYKQHRTGGRPPMCLPMLRGLIRQQDNAMMREGLEADDVLGILATGKFIAGEKILVGIDKDFLQIPGLNYNYETKVLQSISTKQADRYHMLQTLTGDRTDGYPGCPGVGPKKAEACLGQAETVEDMWPRVVKQYERKGQTEQDALLMARVSRILRRSDWDNTNKTVVLWGPPCSTK